MATPKIPLNFYKRITTSLFRSTSGIYTTPFDRAGVVINALVTNNFNKRRSVTFSISGQEQPTVTLLNKFQLEPNDAINIAPNKIILGENDSLLVSGDIEDLNTLENNDIFWEFDLPTSLITLDDFTAGFTTGVNVTADFGVGNVESLSSSFVPLTSFVPVDYVYDLDNSTGTNITLSILEAVNTP
jgi:hypothetical protein